MTIARPSVRLVAYDQVIKVRNVYDEEVNVFTRRVPFAAAAYQARRGSAIVAHSGSNIPADTVH